MAFKLRNNPLRAFVKAPSPAKGLIKALKRRKKAKREAGREAEFTVEGGTRDQMKNVMAQRQQMGSGGVGGTTADPEKISPFGTPTTSPFSPVSPTTYKNSPAKGRQGKLKKGKLLKTEHKDTAVTGGSNREKINDLEDRIGFIKEDVFQQDSKATAKQKKDIAAMEKRISILKK